MSRARIAAWLLLAGLAAGACPSASEPDVGPATDVPASARAAAAFVAALHGDRPGAVTVTSVRFGDRSTMSAACPDALRSASGGQLLLVTVTTPRGEETMATDRDGSFLARCTAPHHHADGVVAQLARQLGVPPSEITVESREAVVFPNGALGCPEPGRLYTQATVPGYRMILRVADRGTVELHTDRDGMRWVQCADGRPVRRGSVR